MTQADRQHHEYALIRNSIRQRALPEERALNKLSKKKKIEFFEHLLSKMKYVERNKIVVQKFNYICNALDWYNIKSNAWDIYNLAKYYGLTDLLTQKKIEDKKTMTSMSWALWEPGIPTRIKFLTKLLEEMKR